MNEIFVAVGVLLVVALVLSALYRKEDAKKQDIARKLLSVENSLYRSRNFAHMSQITQNGVADRHAYIQMINDETTGALKTVRQLKKDVYGA